MIDGPIKVIDSHTGGEPTRVVIEGAPNLVPSAMDSATVAEQQRIFAEHYDAFRRFSILEPRGSEVLVGALLVPPADPTALAGVIFYNNVGYLGMCGHATIGLMVTLYHMGRIHPGVHRLETSVGMVEAELLDEHQVRVRNVPSYRYQSEVEVNVEGYGKIRGDIAWGGNWFFLTPAQNHELSISNRNSLLRFTQQIKRALSEQGITGEAGAEIDHIELFGPPNDLANHGRNFVLCPGNAYDRSPCGTGTSAKLACLAAAGELEVGQTWRQEGIVGSVFSGSFEWADEKIVPTVTGSAFVTAEANLLLSKSDPFQAGILP